MTTKKYELTYLDTCLPDYFHGFRGEVLAVPLSRHPRCGEVLKDLLHEIGASEFFIDGEYAPDDIYEQLRESAKEIFATLDRRKRWSAQGDLSESYAYFGIMEV